MMQFCDYDYYTNEFGGTALDEESFYRVIGDVSAFIERATFGRASRSGLDAVKDAACAAAERAAAIYSARSIRSENTDGYSVTYAEYTQADAEREMYGVICGYLDGLGLLNRLL